MTFFDVFNGDADGLCALHQYRLAHPRDAVLVTGVKRDIALLARIAPRAVAGDEATVLDLSLDVNRSALEELLARGVRVVYFDHHRAGDVPDHPLLDAHIDLAPDACASTVVDDYLGGAHREWAIVGAFGDNMHSTAERLATGLGLDLAATARLRSLGENLNYNGYGDRESDLVIAPADLYRILRRYPDPWGFIGGEPVLRDIDDARRQDLDLARRVQPAIATDGGALYVLPDEPWSRRVRGVFGNELARAEPARAHAVITANVADGYLVSIRAPLVDPHGADQLAQRFPTGGGRAAAAGVNNLPRRDIPAFIDAFVRAFSGGRLPRRPTGGDS